MLMSLLNVLLDFLLGAFVGLLGGLFGIGGGMIVIPLLVILFGFDQQMAQGTALIMVVPNVVLSIRNYNKRDKINLRYVFALSIPSFLFAFIGAYSALSIAAQNLQKIFALFLIVIASYSIGCVILVKNSLLGSKQTTYSLSWFVVLGSICGFLGGLFVVGGGVLATPVLTWLFGLSQLIAQGLALSLALPSLLASLIMYIWHGQLNWSAGIPLALGGLSTVGFGVRLAYALPQKLLKILFSGFLIICAIMLMIK